MNVLDNVGKSYDNYRLNKLTVKIVGMGPTTSVSTLNACLDYEPGNIPTKQSQVLATVPNLSIPAYREGILIANKESLMRRNWFVSNTAATSEDGTAVKLVVFLTGVKDDAPDYLIYCDYDAEFRNPAKPHS
jgi:hypothetical protein